MKTYKEKYIEQSR